MAVQCDVGKQKKMKSSVNISFKNLQSEKNTVMLVYVCALV